MKDFKKYERNEITISHESFPNKNRDKSDKQVHAPINQSKLYSNRSQIIRLFKK